MLQKSLDPNQYHPSPTHEEAIARAHFLVENRRRAGLLVGESGSGKSTVLRILSKQLRRRGCQTAVVNLVGLEVDEMLWQIAVQIGLNPADKLPRYVMWRMISDRFCENRHQRIATVIMLDDVDLASDETIRQVLRLVHVDSSPGSCVTVIFTSCLAEMHRLDERLLSLSELRIELEPWDQKDIAEYLSHCLKRIGWTGLAFDSAAITRLYQLSGGLPRRVHQLTELALLSQADQGIDLINEDTVELAHEELCVAGSQ
jgi:general secretion pathway protein A